jgi:sugar phosphate isomerase/epimerase
MNLPIALQVYSVRELASEDFNGTLARIKELGYDGVEFAGLYGHAPSEVKKWLDEIGLIPASAHIPYVELVKEPQALLSDYALIGCPYAAVPYLTEEYRPGSARFPEVIAGIRKIGQIARSLGITLLYHNHDFEFIKINGEYALDILYREIPADLLQTEIDTCWVRVAGEDPAAYLGKYAGRAPVVHLKDYYMPVRGKDRLYDLMGMEEQPSVQDAAAFEFRPLGYGMQDIPAILAASRQAGAKWLVVEQDQPSMQKSSMECAAMSIMYLRSLQVTMEGARQCPTQC